MSYVLFLGYDKTQTTLIDALEGLNCRVDHTDKSINNSDVTSYDLIISFGYRHILKPTFIERCSYPIVNLHISYLPFNRGAHPNFWSFYDRTQSGVSIHLIDGGIDTGPILFQKKVSFTNELTFSQTYKKLFVEIEELFVENIEAIITKNWVEKHQKSKGTFHLAKDLPKDFKGWDSNIKDEIERLKKLV